MIVNKNDKIVKVTFDKKKDNTGLTKLSYKDLKQNCYLQYYKWTLCGTASQVELDTMSGSW